VTETKPRTGLHRRWLLFGASVAAIALIAWAVFHPEFRPDPNAVSAAMLDEFSKTGFKQTRGISAARFEYSRSIDGLTETGSSEQRIVPLNDLLTEKRSIRRTTGLAEEMTGIYVGPFSVVHFYRSKPPVIGDLLPFSLWASSRMTRFVVEEVDKFPGTKGGKLRAKVTYEDQYADGHLLQTESRVLQCTVTNVVAAATILTELSGSAARIECNEDLEADGRKVGPTNPQTWSQGRVSYAHWYIMDNQWSIPSEGEMTIRLHGSDTVRRWTNKVVSFQRNSYDRRSP
jgi:hypothetical protein